MITNPYLITLIIVGSFTGLAAIVLFVGRLLTRTDLYRSLAGKGGVRSPRSRILEDLRPAQNFMAEFVLESEPSHRLLKHVQKHQPLSLRALLQEYSFDDAEQDRSVLVEKLFTAVFILAVSGLVRFGQGGMSLTDVGREVLTRIEDTSLIGQAESSRLEESSSQVNDSKMTSGPTAAHDVGSKSHLQLVKDTVRRTTTPATPNRAMLAPGFRLGQLRTAAKQATPPILLSAADHHELAAAIVATRKLAVGPRETQALQHKLTTATIVHPGDVPCDLITMGSRAELLDLDSKERPTFTLVFPIDANLDAGRISVFDSLGTTMLGRRAGDQLEWAVPYGIRRFEVTAVGFQPEAALALAA